MRLPLRLLLVTLFVTPLAAQDTEFLRALEKAQESRPATLTATARIAPESEPGTPLVIHGHAFAEDGTTPLANAIIFAYHTDKNGLYDRAGSPPHSWRLRGWAKTDATGAFEFHTIRPASYPASRNPAHVHVTIFSGPSRYHAGGLLFADDGFLTDRDREESKRLGEFGSICTVRHDGATEHVDFNVKVVPGQRF
jgi:protocatechuate 3,4-dioxygenase beta subunit